MDVDAVVIGGGHNGLVAANLLADRGWDVVLLEATEQIGGSVRSAELIEPGFVNDVCSAFYPLGAASPVLSRLGLERYGLRWRHAPAVLAHPLRDGCATLWQDVDTTAAALDAQHAGDGEAWMELIGRWQQVGRPLLESMLAPFPPVRASVRVARAAGPSRLLHLARFLLLPARRMGDERFGGEAPKLLLAGAAQHADLGSEAPLSGFFGWLMCGLGHDVGFPVPEGGAGRITEALAARLRSSGGRVECGVPAARVAVRNRRAVGVRTAAGDVVAARRAVIAAVSAPLLYRSLLRPEDLPPQALADVDRFHWDRATVKVDWTLDAPIPWSAEPARQAGTVHVADDRDALTRYEADLACGVVPARPFLIVGQQSMTDPTRQPAGRETAWAYTHVPRHVRGGDITHRWAEQDREAMVARIEGAIEAHAPGFRRLVRGRHVLTPPAFEAENPSLSLGSLNYGTSQLHQQLVFRPVPNLARPETPVRRLFLGSASAHPGGGVHGAPGANAARAALLHDRLGRPRLVTRRRTR